MGYIQQYYRETKILLKWPQMTFWPSKSSQLNGLEILKFIPKIHYFCRFRAKNEFDGNIASYILWTENVSILLKGVRSSKPIESE